MNVIDTHLHLDDKYDGDLRKVVNHLDDQLIANNVSRGVVLHLIIQKWSYQEVGDLILSSKRLKAFVNIDPFLDSKYQSLEDASKNYGFIGLKLHPRLQKFDLLDERVIELCKFAGTLNLPVLLDAFPDGNAIMDGFKVDNFAKLALACNDTRFIWAHFGGHKVLDFMMVAKRLPNVFLDLSYSWLYYLGSSVTQDLAYALKSMKFEKVFYGSDYPDRNIETSLKMSLEVFDTLQIDSTQIEKVMFSNAKKFFNWHDL